MGVMTPDTPHWVQPLTGGATCASKLASARPRMLSGSQKMAGGMPAPVGLLPKVGRTLAGLAVNTANGAHDSTALAGTCAGVGSIAVTATGFAVTQLLGIN